MLLVIVCGVALIALFISLAWWQYQRGIVKKQMEYRITHKTDLKTVHSSDLVSPAVTHLDLSPVSLSVSQVYQGYILLDNRVRARQSGLELVIPVRTDAGWILVNMGWLAWTRGTPLPGNPLTGQQLVQPVKGTLRNWPEEGFTIGEQDYGDTLPHKLLWLEYDQLSRYFDYTLLPYIVYIDADHPQALTTDWQFAGTVSPIKHYSYAVQWLAMALVTFVIILYIIAKMRGTRGLRS